MKSTKLITLLLLITFLFPAHTQPPIVQAQEIRYDWKGLSMRNGTRYDLPGGYKLQAEIIYMAGAAWYVRARILKEGTPCSPYVYTAIEEYAGGTHLDTRKEIPVYEECPRGGKRLYKVLIKGDETDMNNGIIYFDILESVFSPETNLTMELDFPKVKEFDQPYAQFQVPMAIRNEGPQEVEWVKVYSNWYRLEGEGSINLTNVLPVTGTKSGNEVNVTLGGLEANESHQLTFTFYAGPGEGKYGNYTVNFIVTYPTLFEYEGFDSNRSVKIFRYNPNATKSISDSINVVFGLTYKGHTGKPRVVLSISKPTGDLQVDPGTPITFDFRVQNTGNDHAYNVTINAKIDPDLPIEIIKPSSVAGGRFPIVVHADMPPRAMTEPIEFRIVIPSDAEGMMYRVNLSVGYFDIRGTYNESFRLFTINVREFGVSKLYVTKTISSTTIPVNGTIQIDIIVGNNGTAAATNVVIEDDYPKDIFKLVSGKTKLTASKLNPGSMLSLSYKLKAVREGVANFGPAKVTYVDPKEGQKVLLSAQKSPVVVTIVKPQLSVRVEDIPQNVTVVNSLVGFSIYMINRGSGDAKDLTVEMELSPGFYMVNPPTIKKGEGVSCEQPVWEPEEDKIRVKMVCDTIRPEGFVKLILTLKTQTTGKQWIRVKDISYKSPDGLTTLKIPTSSYRYETVVVTPLELRMFYLAIFTFSVLLVAMFVIGVTRGFRISVGRRKPRTGFGALES